MSEKRIIEFYKKVLGIKTNKKEIYIKAITHKSYNSLLNNERLEFLGDAVLDLVISKHLFKKHPYACEGYLTIEKSKYVCRKNLNNIADKLIGKKIIRHNSRVLSSNMLGNTLESIIGALYVDKGIKDCERFIYKYILCFEKKTYLEKIFRKIKILIFYDKKVKIT